MSKKTRNTRGRTFRQQEMASTDPLRRNSLNTRQEELILEAKLRKDAQVGWVAGEGRRSGGETSLGDMYTFTETRSKVTG